MTILFGLIGIAGSFFLIKYREYIGEIIGDADWMRYVGGPYNLVIVVAILIFFWSIAAITGTQDVFLSPLLWLLPGGNKAPAVDTF